MTPAETARLLEHVTQRWPHAQLPAGTGDVWLADLADLPAQDAMAAVRRWALAGEPFPPTSGWVLTETQRAAQTDAPSFDELQAWLARHYRLLAYGDSNTPVDTPVTIALLTDAGAHEAVLRFVAAHGVYAARFAPDPRMHGLDLNGHANRRDLARDYRGRIVVAWRSDPTPGLALQRACRNAGIEPADVLELAARRREQLAPPARLALPAPASESVEDDGPMVEFDPAELIKSYRAERSRARGAEMAATRERLAEQRRQEREEREAAEREIAEHAAARQAEGGAR